MRYELCCAAALLVAIPSSLSQLPLKECQKIRFGGEVSREDEFQRSIGGDLTFRLRPEKQAANPPGWTIAIGRESDPLPQHDYLLIATPPYRFWNPRYLDTSYGYSAREAVEITPRRFNFVVREEQFEILAAALDKLLWSYGHSEEELEQAQKTFDSMKLATGELRILASRIGGSEQGGPGWIEWLKFEVELCVACDFTIPISVQADRSSCKASLGRKPK